jgi:hypothetical protein
LNFELKNKKKKKYNKLLQQSSPPPPAGKTTERTVYFDAKEDKGEFHKTNRLKSIYLFVSLLFYAFLARSFLWVVFVNPGEITSGSNVSQ